MTINYDDAIILLARLLLTSLYLVFGWRKLRDERGTVAQMRQLGVITPVLAAAVSTFIELPVALAVAIGLFGRPAAFLMALYTLGTALIGHRYWKAAAADRVESMDGFYKDLSIVGGFLLVWLSGPGSYSIDMLRGIPVR